MLFSGIASSIKAFVTLKTINTNVESLNKQLDKTIQKLRTIDELTSKVAKNLKQVTGNGGHLGLGTSGKAQMSGSLAPVNPATFSMPTQAHMPSATESRARFFMRQGGTQMVAGGVQAVLGLGGAAFAAVPGMDIVGANALGYYQASLGTGINPMRIQRQTFEDLAGGFSSTGSGAAAAAVLRNRFMMPGTAQFRQSMQEVRGAFRYLGMSNETAAGAIGSLQSGPMGANLYQYGVNIIDPVTGKGRKTSDIARDLFARMFPTGANRKEVMASLQYGYAGANLRNMGFSAEQQEIFSQMFLDIGAGKDPDLTKKKFGEGSPLPGVEKIARAESETIMDKQGAMLRGFEKGADAVEFLNKGLRGLPDLFFELKGATDAVIGSQVGQGLTGLSVAIQGLIGVIVGATSMLMASAGLSAVGGTVGAAGLGAIAKTVGKAALKGAGAIGGVVTLGSNFVTGKGAAERGEGFDWGNLLESTAGGALAGGIIGGGLPGAIVGGVLGGGAYVLGSVLGGQGGPNEPNATSSNPLLPVGNVRVSSNYGMRQVKALGHTKPKMHRGTDYAVPIGSPVKAVNDGTVIRIENSTRGYEGWHVLVDHGGGWSTLYAHLSQVKVSNGEHVRKGQIIGLSGTAGTGPHLHFEVRKNGVATDPSRYMTGAKAGKYTDIGQDDVLGSLGGLGTSVGSSVGSLATLEISGVKGREFTLSKMYGKQSATEMLSGNYISMGSDGLGYDAKDVNSMGVRAHASNNRPMQKPALLKTLYKAGFKKPQDLAEAYAIAMAESNGRPGAYNGNRGTGDDSYGIFQINMIDDLGDARLKKFGFMGLHKKEDLFDPQLNARIAAWMSQKGNNWSAWSSYGGSRYRQFLPSEDELIKTMAELGIAPTSMRVGGDGGSDGTIPRMAGSSGSSGSIVNHAGNTVNITVQVQRATETEAVNLARRVKEIIEHDKSFSAIGGQ